MVKRWSLKKKKTPNNQKNLKKKEKKEKWEQIESNQNKARKKHAKANRFKVVEKSLKVIGIIMMRFLYKAFIFLKPWSNSNYLCLHVKTEYGYYVGIAALFHLRLKHLIHWTWTPTSETFSFTLYLQIFKFDLAKLLQTGIRSCCVVFHTTFEILMFSAVILLVSSQAHTICRTWSQSRFPHDTVQLITNHFAQIISPSKRIPVASAWFGGVRSITTSFLYAKRNILIQWK